MEYHFLAQQVRQAHQVDPAQTATPENQENEDPWVKKVNGACLASQDSTVHQERQVVQVLKETEVILVWRHHAHQLQVYQAHQAHKADQDQKDTAAKISLLKFQSQAHQAYQVTEASMVHQVQLAQLFQVHQAHKVHQVEMAFAAILVLSQLLLIADDAITITNAQAVTFEGTNAQDRLVHTTNAHNVTPTSMSLEHRTASNSGARTLTLLVLYRLTIILKKTSDLNFCSSRKI